MSELTITDVARQSGARAATIRYDESIEVLPAPRRSNGRRRYDSAILERLRFIRVAQRLGFSLAEIRQRATPDTTAPLSERWHTLRTGLRCGCVTLERCMDCVLDACADLPARTRTES